MANITNGSVTYERRVKTGDFEHKQAAVVVHYVLEQGEGLDVADTLIGQAGALAAQHVFGMLRAKPSDGSPVCATIGERVPAAQTEAGRVDSGAPGAPVVVPAAPVVSAAPVQTASDPVEIELPAAPVTNLKAAKRAVRAKTVPEMTVSEERAAVPDTTETLGGVVLPPEHPPESRQLVDALDPVVEDFVAEAPAATDAELGQALSRVQAKLKDRPRILLLIGEFVTSGESYTKIPAVRRSEFLTKLEALA